MEESCEGMSNDPPEVVVNVNVKNVIVDAFTTTTPTTSSTTVSDDNKTSNVANDTENDCTMAEGKYLNTVNIE
jgi:hypothetical protein